ncbi:hypothetical protein NOW01_03045 [Anoxybacillus salavatliensis]|uniref:glycosyltransferase n=1 Tax=Anoxybacillus gonensis TaxID=198467 RepID=UPI00214AE3AF|nr:glycosyltransferase [Anoxybacillus gonensis]MCQ5363981.1 hypothetical protein [Anoxybacillus gonensis]
MSVILACFFIWTVVNSLFLVPLPKRSVFTDRPLVSVLVPLQHFFIFFHLPLVFANYTNMRATTAAHGACLFFERTAYEAIGGHASVKQELVEDVMIARKMKEHRYRVILANVSTHVVCYMYETNKEVWAGFLKNVYIGLNRSPLFVLLLTMFTAYVMSRRLFSLRCRSYMEQRTPCRLRSSLRKRRTSSGRRSARFRHVIGCRSVPRRLSY